MMFGILKVFLGLINAWQRGDFGILEVNTGNFNILNSISYILLLIHN